MTRLDMVDGKTFSTSSEKLSSNRPYPVPSSDGCAREQYLLGHSRVSDSFTCSEYVRPRSVKRLSGCSRRVGRSYVVAIRPVRMDGTASVVHSWTVVAFGYQTPSRASRAKFGYRTASIDP